MLWDECGHANTEVDVKAVFDFPRRAAGNVMSLGLGLGLGVGGTGKWGGGGRRGGEGCEFNLFGRGCVDDSIYVDSREVDRVRRDGAYGNYILCLKFI